MNGVKWKNERDEVIDFFHWYKSDRSYVELSSGAKKKKIFFFYTYHIAAHIFFKAKKYLWKRLITLRATRTWVIFHWFTVLFLRRKIQLPMVIEVSLGINRNFLKILPIKTPLVHLQVTVSRTHFSN